MASNTKPTITRVETDWIEEWGSIWDEPKESPEFYPGLKRYYIDDVPVTEDEFRKAVETYKP